MNDYTRMQQTLGMQHLQTPLSNSSSSSRKESRQQQQQPADRQQQPRSSTNQEISTRKGAVSSNSSSSQNRNQAAAASSLRNGGPISSSSVRDRATPVANIAPSSSNRDNNRMPAHSSNAGSQAPIRSQAPAPSAPSAVKSAAVAPPSSGGGDPAADEQNQIWKQIQADLEQKEMELALQLSQRERKTAQASSSSGAGSIRSAAARSGGGGGDSVDSAFVYPDQHGKSPNNGGTSSGSTNEEDEALQEILRISQEEAAAAEAARSKAPQVDEDEIAMVMQLSKKQAEEDQERMQRLRESSGELSEDEQMRMAMEQSMQPEPPQDTQDNDSVCTDVRLALEESMQPPSRMEAALGSGDAGGNCEVDDDMALAMRLSAQLDEEEQFRHSRLRQKPPRRHEESVRSRDDSSVGSDAFAGMVQALPGSFSQPSRPPTQAPPRRAASSRLPSSPGLEQPRVSNLDRWGEQQSVPQQRQQQQDPVPIPQPVNPEFSSQEFYVQPFPDSDVHHTHDPDDGTDALPASRPQRKVSDEEKDSSLKLTGRPVSRSRSSSYDVDVDEETRVAMVREGQLDTRMAIMQGQSQIVTCQGCMGKLHAPTQCSLVFCPTCNTVSPVQHAISTASVGDRKSVV